MIRMKLTWDVIRIARGLSVVSFVFASSWGCLVLGKHTVAIMKVSEAYDCKIFVKKLKISKGRVVQNTILNT